MVSSFLVHLLTFAVAVMSSHLIEMSFEWLKMLIDEQTEVGWGAVDEGCEGLSEGELALVRRMFAREVVHPGEGEEVEDGCR